MATFGKLFLGVWIALVLVATFLWLPSAVPAAAGGVFSSPDLARIIILHLPNSMVVIVAAFVSGWYALRYLTRGRDPVDDIRSKTSVALAALFCVLATVTGSVFARVEWGAYWNWDPKQICIFLLLLIYAAYFVLRAGIEDAEKRASVCAVYVLFAVVMTPMLGYVVPKYMATQSLHPKNTQFDAAYSWTLLAAGAGFIGLYAWLQNIAVRADLVRMAWEEYQCKE
ncbi:MAG: cytochrome c biogenesis protein CcsA [Capsulimonadaceae bacterium]|nr:cytochrome c biogenesis protein CcsA [Capsulimonadaceae bacterium]